MLVLYRRTYPGLAIIVLENLHVLHIPAAPHMVFQILYEESLSANCLSRGDEQAEGC